MGSFYDKYVDFTIFLILSCTMCWGQQKDKSRTFSIFRNPNLPTTASQTIRATLEPPKNNSCLSFFFISGLLLLLAIIQVHHLEPTEAPRLLEQLLEQSPIPSFKNMLGYGFSSAKMKPCKYKSKLFRWSKFIQLVWDSTQFYTTQFYSTQFYCVFFQTSRWLSVDFRLLPIKSRLWWNNKCVR